MKRTVSIQHSPATALNRFAVGVFVTSFTLSLLACSPASEPELFNVSPADTFRLPTHKGALLFDRIKRLSFTDEENFYSLSFDLTDHADIDIRTETYTANLDTVIYLYRWREESASWGRYIKKNDDNDGSLASRITLDNAKAGLYLVKIKGHKIQTRGDFGVFGICDGPGCPDETDELTCNPAQRTHIFPAETGYGESCAAKLYGALPAGTAADPHLQNVTYENRCSVSPIVSKAIELFTDFFHLEEAGTEILDESTFFYVHLPLREQGGGDFVYLGNELHDLSLAMVFSSDSALIATYRSDSGSAEVHWTCAEPSDPMVVEEPSADCLQNALINLPHHNGTEFSMVGQATFLEFTDARDQNGQYIMHAIAERFVDGYSIDHSEPLAYEALSWSQPDWGDAEGSIVQFLAPGDEIASYVFTDGYRGAWLLFEKLGNDAPKMVCEEISP